VTSQVFLPEQLVQRVHRTATRLVLAVTGGGSGAIAELLRVPGASRTVLEAVVPYARGSLAGFLGGECEQLCSDRTARAMAMAAWQRAVKLVDESADGEPDGTQRTAGVACTASLASDRPKRGPHRAHIAVQTEATTRTASVNLAKGHRSRSEEEDLIARLVLNHVASACGVEQSLSLDLAQGERVETACTHAEPDWRDLLLGRIDATCAGGPPPVEKHHTSGAVFPGAFDPLHEGHRRMAEVAAEWLGTAVEFELSIENVDKPPLDYTEIARRRSQFSPTQPLWLTRAATFFDKSQIFPGASFLVGADTIVRVADARYYGGDEAACRNAIESIAQRACRFLVFGRFFNGTFQSLKDLDLPSNLQAICQEIPEHKCRIDVSSTEIRQGKTRPG